MNNALEDIEIATLHAHLTYKNTAVCASFVGSMKCAKCPAGKWKSSAGNGVEADVCNVCPTGKYSDEGGSVCDKCASGYYGTAATSCSPCSPGRYQSAAMMDLKKTCVLFQAWLDALQMIASTVAAAREVHLYPYVLLERIMQMV